MGQQKNENDNSINKSGNNRYKSQNKQKTANSFLMKNHLL